MADAHDKLDEAFEANSPTLEGLIRELFAEGERVKGFYEGLSKK